MTNEELERAALWNSLTNLGNYVQLDLRINESEVTEKLEQIKDRWCPYNQK